MGLKVPPAGAVVVGSAAHGAIEYLNKIKGAERKAPPKDEVLDVYDAKFEEEAPDAIWDEEAPAEAKDRGYRSLGLYYDTAAELVQPAGPEAVEEKLIVPLPEVDAYLHSIVDARTEQGEILDYKTTSKRVSEAPRDATLQLWLYEHIYSLKGIPIHGRKLWYLVCTKKPEVYSMDIDAAPIREAERWLRTLAQIRASMVAAVEAGRFLPAPPGQYWCSPKWCGYWDLCQKEEW
jgi:hypothetical protein